MNGTIIKNNNSKKSILRNNGRLIINKRKVNNEVVEKNDVNDTDTSAMESDNTIILSDCIKQTIIERIIWEIVAKGGIFINCRY